MKLIFILKLPLSFKIIYMLSILIWVKYILLYAHTVFKIRSRFKFFPQFIDVRNIHMYYYIVHVI